MDLLSKEERTDGQTNLGNEGTTENFHRDSLHLEISPMIQDNVLIDGLERNCVATSTWNYC